jgi:hypothetical protein
VDKVVEIAGLLSRLLVASGVPPWAVYAGCLVLAVLLILAPPLASAAWEAVKRIRPEPAPEHPSDGGPSGPGVPLPTGKPDPTGGEG